MKQKNRARNPFKKLVNDLKQAYPEVLNPEDLIRKGRVLVDRRIVTNPASLVRADASIVIQKPPVLRGEPKLRAALDKFQIRLTDRVALDVGAAAGGFTRVLLEGGVRRCYAVDAGHGQLLGSLRCDSRVVNLEATNVGTLSRHLVPEPIDVVTMDLSYLPVADAVPQLEQLAIADTADLIALVKPMFELRLPAPPKKHVLFRRAIELAVRGVERSGWSVARVMSSPLLGTRGSQEFFLHARRIRTDER